MCCRCTACSTHVSETPGACYPAIALALPAPPPPLILYALRQGPIQLCIATASQLHLTAQVGFFLVEDAVQRQAGGSAGQGLDVVAQVGGACRAGA